MTTLFVTADGSVVDYACVMGAIPQLFLTLTLPARKLMDAMLGFVAFLLFLALMTRPLH